MSGRRGWGWEEDVDVIVDKEKGTFQGDGCGSYMELCICQIN